MRGILTAIFLMAALTGASFAKDPLAGTYELKMSDDAGWHRNTLTIDADGKTGILGLDLGIGPQARAPQPDERLHALPIKIQRSKSGGLHFTVPISNTTYAFALYPVDGCLAGTVLVTPDKREDGMEVTGPWTRGVLARRSEP